MRKIILIITIMFSAASSAQSLDCQMMRNEILSQANQQQQQQQQQRQQQQQQALTYAQMTPMQQAQLSIYQGGQQLGNALAGIGQPTLQEKIQIYKQRCE
jgi:hypothetical protein